MDKLKMHSLDVIGSNIEKIQLLFPNCVTERLGKDGKPELAIDFEKLQAELSNEIIGEGEERYQFTWPDKRAANRLANTPTTMTLRPCREESVDFDHTQNLYIEGDNLDVLKALRETYLGKVKMIYIDPPYNTGNDFVYNDDFAQSRDEFEETSGLFDEEGNQTIDPMQRNTESNGRFHTDWLNMIYPRLKVARDLLSDDGVIFISIDDNEVENLRKVCDEIFGECNFIGCAGRISKKANNQGDFWAPNFDYILTYTKNKTLCPSFFGGINYSAYNQIETDGPRKGERYQLVRLYMTSLDPMRGCSNQRYYIECPDGSYIIPISKVTFGFVSGGSEFGSLCKIPIEETYKHPFGGGSGAGITVKPVAFLILRKDIVRLLPVEQNNTYDRVVDSVPQIIDIVKGFFSEDKKNKSETNCYEKPFSNTNCDNSDL